MEQTHALAGHCRALIGPVPGTSTRYFSIVTGCDVDSIWVCNGSHFYVSYDAESRSRLAKDLKITRVHIKPFGVFV